MQCDDKCEFLADTDCKVECVVESNKSTTVKRKRVVEIFFDVTCQVGSSEETSTSKVVKRSRATRKDIKSHVFGNEEPTCDGSLDPQRSRECSRRMNVALKLSRCVDLAREAISKRIQGCASWRRSGMNIIIHLVHAYGIQDEIAAHSIVLLDRFLAANLEGSARAGFDPAGIWGKSSCYAIACFLLATKFKGVCSPCITDLVHIARPPWSEETILQCEEEVLSSISWSLHVTTGKALRCPPLLPLHSAPPSPPAIVLLSAHFRIFVFS
jgi:hypothetical protein